MSDLQIQNDNVFKSPENRDAKKQIISDK